GHVPKPTGCGTTVSLVERACTFILGRAQFRGFRHDEDRPRTVTGTEDRAVAQSTIVKAWPSRSSLIPTCTSFPPRSCHGSGGKQSASNLDLVCTYPCIRQFWSTRMIG